MKKHEKTNTWLYMSFKHDITDSFGNTIPYPHKHFINSDSTVYAWLIDGFFGTKKGLEHLNDIIARFLLTFPDSKYIKHFNDSHSIISPFKLKAFYNLKSKVNKRKDYIRSDVLFDSTFWVLKYYAEDLIKEDGFIIYQKLEDFAMENFASKEKSTLRCKCRNIYYWYDARDWQIGRAERKFETKGELMASRSNHMKKINKERQELAKKKVLSCVTGMFEFEYKKKNGDWNISKIAKESGTSRNTVYKYIAELTP